MGQAWVRKIGNCKSMGCWIRRMIIRVDHFAALGKYYMQFLTSNFFLKMFYYIWDYYSCIYLYNTMWDHNLKYNVE